ncbi:MULTISPECIES: hypothetical protein [unclassified Sphingomonas]|uniref:DUF7668 domain-containing protein n=1 Tax=unclassified Sphingomonas TaxID=196159 RepID=UPI002150B590|nr:MULTISPECIES: hypothetical protein [unclassified Sphingomonas]MCR5870220.1 hypothetical protein [Sphingomonas sp. J344]UUX98094.1 hypothetical protein LRS08_10715 [Sphingomonas sp. J315]
MLSADVETTIRRIIVAVSTGDYRSALAEVSRSRCSAEDLSRAISEHGRALSAPPFADWDVIAVGNEVGQEWSVRAPLWSQSEGGRSDLELRLTVMNVDGETSIELDDILVA